MRFDVALVCNTTQLPIAVCPHIMISLHSSLDHCIVLSPSSIQMAILTSCLGNLSICRTIPLSVSLAAIYNHDQICSIPEERATSFLASFAGYLALYPWSIHLENPYS